MMMWDVRQYRWIGNGVALNHLSPDHQKMSSLTRMLLTNLDFIEPSHVSRFASKKANIQALVLCWFIICVETPQMEPPVVSLLVYV